MRVSGREKRVASIAGSYPRKPPRCGSGRSATVGSFAYVVGENLARRHSFERVDYSGRAAAGLVHFRLGAAPRLAPALAYFFQPPTQPPPVCGTQLERRRRGSFSPAAGSSGGAGP